MTDSSESKTDIVASRAPHPYALRGGIVLPMWTLGTVRPVGSDEDDAKQFLPASNRINVVGYILFRCE